MDANNNNNPPLNDIVNNLFHSTDIPAKHNVELSPNNSSTRIEENIIDSNHASLQDSSSSENVEANNRDARKIAFSHQMLS